VTGERKGQTRTTTNGFKKGTNRKNDFKKISERERENGQRGGGGKRWRTACQNKNMKKVFPPNLFTWGREDQFY